MTKIVVYKEGRGYAADRLNCSGSPIVGRGRTKGEALGNLLFLTRKYERITGGIEILEAKDQDGFWELMRAERERPSSASVLKQLLEAPIELDFKAPKDWKRTKYMNDGKE